MATEPQLEELQPSAFAGCVRPAEGRDSGEAGGQAGKRKGAPGAGLAMVENPDRVEDHRPGACSDCGEVLGDALSVASPAARSAMFRW